MWHASFGVLAMNKYMIGSVAALAMVAGAVSPAAARPYWGGGYYGGHRHGGGDAFGNFLLGAIVAGGAVAIASNAGKNSGSNRAIPSRGIDDVRGAGEDARAVASICSDAAESMAHGKVLGVDSVGRDGDGWRVEGTVEADRGDRYFSCGAREGRVDFLKLGDFASR
jgi:hypothetical protein